MIRTRCYQNGLEAVIFFCALGAPVVITPPLRQIFAVEGDIVTIRCEAAGTPIPVVSWRVNWGNVPPPPRVTMTSVNGLGTLIIR